MATEITESQVRNRATAQSFSKGLSYYNNGAIFNTARHGNTLEGYCEGSMLQPYHIEATLDEDGIKETYCTCPYDWGGDCKHIIALLLTYIHEPVSFPKQEALEEKLMQRSKEELVKLITEMIRHSPDLRPLADRPMPTAEGKRRTPLDTESFRRELRYAIGHYGGWGDYGPVQTVNSIVKTANEFAEAGDWSSARAIYSTVVDECFDDPDDFIDDDGDFLYAASHALDGLLKCLQQKAIADDDTERMAALNSILDAYIWDIDFGGIDACPYEPSEFLTYAKQQDFAAIRKRIEDALEKQRGKRYSEWGVEAYEDFLVEMDVLDHVDPEIVLTRLREREMYELLAERLLGMGRTEDAIKVINDDLPTAYQRLRVLPLLVEAGQTDAAIRLAQEALDTDYHNHLVTWLLEQYEEQGNTESHIQLQLRRLKHQPHLQFYVQLKEAAASRDEWPQMRADIIAALKDKDTDTLARIYLHDEEWDAAWAITEKEFEHNRAEIYSYSHWLDSLKMEVAEASRLIRPHKAIPVYQARIHQLIGMRKRDQYAEAAARLRQLREVYQRINDEAAWQALVRDIRAEYKQLPALKDEMNKASLPN